MDIPVLNIVWRPILTAKMSHEEKIESLKHGVIEYMYKPFSIDVLKAKISTILKMTSDQKKAAISHSIELLQEFS